MFPHINYSSDYPTFLFYPAAFQLMVCISRIFPPYYIPTLLLASIVNSAK